MWCTMEIIIFRPGTDPIVVAVLVSFFSLRRPLQTRSSAVAVIADRTACKFAVRTGAHLCAYTAVGTRHCSVGTRIGGRSERHCADWRPYKRR